MARCLARYSFSSGVSPKLSSASSSRSLLSGAVSSVSGMCSSMWSPGSSSATTFVLAVSPVTAKRTATSARPWKCIGIRIFGFTVITK